MSRRADRIVSRCIEPDPDKRYPNTEALAADLDRLDDSGVAAPGAKRVVGMRTAADAGGVLLLALCGDVVVSRGARRAGGSADRGVGADRRLREHHRRSTF